jgi:hypothetical protein
LTLLGLKLRPLSHPSCSYTHYDIPAPSHSHIWIQTSDALFPSSKRQHGGVFYYSEDQQDINLSLPISPLRLLSQNDIITWKCLYPNLRYYHTISLDSTMMFSCLQVY